MGASLRSLLLPSANVTVVCEAIRQAYLAEGYAEQTGRLLFKSFTKNAEPAVLQTAAHHPTTLDPQQKADIVFPALPKGN